MNLTSRVSKIAIAIAIVSTVGSTVNDAVGSAAPSTTVPVWSFPNGNLANTRDVTDSAISQRDVASLKEVWSFKITGKAAKSLAHLGSLAATPIIVDNVVYIQDLRCDVYALSLSSGALIWKYTVNQPEKSGPGPNGVAVANGVVYGLTPTAAFALDAANGHSKWINTKILTQGQGTFGIQPQVADGRMYIASQYGSAPGGGVLVALNAANGHVLWKFNTVLDRSRGVSSLGLGAGGAWETPLVGADGSVTFGTGNPYQSLSSAIHYPSKIRYTDSEVNLNATTGALRWYYQAVPNDFKDFDMQASPIATTVDGRPAIIGGGKMGIVYAMNARSGALLWKTPVGDHNGHDNDSLNLLEHKGALTLPYSFVPGTLGGILTNMSVAGNTVYVATNNLNLRFTNENQIDGVAPKKVRESGDVEALNVTTGKVEWDTKFAQFPLGATTVDNDLVFTTLYNGDLIALSRATGAVVYRSTLPASTNAPIAIAGNTVIIPAGGPETSSKASEVPQVIAYRLG